jgi:hypothetical protein
VIGWAAPHAAARLAHGHGHVRARRTSREEALMAVFADEAEVYEYLGGVFRIGLEDPQLVASLQPSGVVLRITYTKPDAVVTVDMPNSELHTGAGNGPAPNIELFMSADTGNKFWLGKVVLPVAMAKGDVRAKGPVSKLLKLLPLAKQLFGPYKAKLEAEGRDDLLKA